MEKRQRPRRINIFHSPTALFPDVKELLHDFCYCLTHLCYMKALNASQRAIKGHEKCIKNASR